MAQSRDVKAMATGPHAITAEVEEPGGGGGAPSDSAFAQTLAGTWWGSKPWKRYLSFLAVLAGPALVLVRVARVVNSPDDAWYVLQSLNLTDWLRVLTGSFVAWLPWSATYVETVASFFLTWAAVQTFYASGAFEMERGKAVTIGTYGDIGLLLIILVPVGVVFFTVRLLPFPYYLPPLLAAPTACFVASEQMADAYRVAKIELVIRKRNERAATLLEIVQAKFAAAHLRFSGDRRDKLASFSVFLFLLLTISGLYGAVADRTPWVPKECVVYPEGHTMEGYMLGEGVTDLVLRPEDRGVLLLPSRLVVRRPRC